MSIQVDLAHEAQFRIGAVEVRPSTCEIARDDRVEVLEPRVVQVLVALARRRGEVVSHADLINACWGGRSVSDDAIHRCISRLRRLGENTRAFSIKSVARVGYRLDEAPPPQEFSSARDRNQATQPANGHPFERRSPLVGRENQLGELRRLLALALERRGGMVLLAGEAGIGKTRLAEEIGAEAARSGAMVLTGHCRDLSADATYAPIVDLLEEAARKTPSASFREALGEDAAQIAKIYPLLHRLFDDVPPALKLPRGQERRFLFSSLHAYLERAARAQPLVLVLEDLHWADEETAAILRQLARRMPDAPMLLVGTYRDLQREIGRPFAELLEECLRQRVVEVVQLKSLSESETAELVAALAGRPFARGRLVGPDPPSTQAGVIHAATRGNPFFIEEAVRHLASEGRLYDSDGCVRIDVRPDELAASEGMRLVINKRVERLTPTARRVIAAAAVIGPRFATEVLEQMDPGGEDVVLDALGEAESAGLVKVEAGRYGFAHDLIRQAVLAALPPPRRRRLHRQIAEAIERAYPDAASSRAVELGHHLARAEAPEGDPTETIDRLRRAGELALEAYAHEEALSAYEAALALLPSDATALRANLLAERAEALDRLGARDRSVEDLEQAIAIQTRVGDAAAVARFTTMLAHRFWTASRIQDGVAACRHAVTGLDDRLTGDRAILLAWEGCFLFLLRDHAAGEALLTEAERVAVQLDDARAMAWVFDRRASAHLDLDESRDAAAWGMRAAEMAKRSSVPGLAATNLTVAAGALLDLGRWDEALAAVDEAEPLSQQTGEWHLTIHCQLIRGAIVGPRGARIADDDDRIYVRKARGMHVDGSAFRMVVSGLDLTGRWEEALLEHERALHADDRSTRIFAWAGLLAMKARLGDRAGAEAMLAERWSASDSWPRYQRRRRTSWHRDFAIATTLVLLGRDEEAGRFYEAFLEYSRRNRPMEALLGITAAAGGRWEAAETHFANALAEAERLPNLFAQADYRADWGRALIRRDNPGDRARAVRLLGEAADRYAGMGMHRHAAEARQILEANVQAAALPRSSDSSPGSALFQ